MKPGPLSLEIRSRRSSTASGRPLLLISLHLLAPRLEYNSEVLSCRYAALCLTPLARGALVVPLALDPSLPDLPSCTSVRYSS